MRAPIQFPYYRGAISAVNFGQVSVGDVTIHPYEQPQPYFTITRNGDEARFTTDGEQLLRENLGERVNPILVRSSFPLLGSLMILPPDRRLTLHDVDEMRLTISRNGVIMELPAARFGLPAGSAIVFDNEYRGKLNFVDIDLLVEDENR